MKKKKGFTLVELLAVILIIAIIAALALTLISKYSSKMKNLSTSMVEELVKSSAKSYLNNNQKLKEEIKNTGTGVITYNDLKEKGYLNDKLSEYEQNVSDSSINLSNVCVGVSYNYSENKYSYVVQYECGKWITENGKKYYEYNGVRVTGLQKINNKLYYFNTQGEMQTGWQTINNKKYYFADSGVAVKSWQQIGSSWYYFDASGIMKVGWFQDNETGRWYYFDTDGKMATGSKNINSKNYYFYTPSPYDNNKIGMMASDEFIDGYWYNGDGSRQEGVTYQWHQDATGWYYSGSDGWFATGKSYWIDGKQESFNSNSYWISQ